MASKQIITVFGATGNQGGSVIDAFLADKELTSKWQIRAVTRDPSKEASKKLAERGVEVVVGDMNDKASLVKALEGSHTVFAVTDYWASLNMETEVQQGINMADAAKEVGVKHFIWSTLCDINKISNGALPNVYHFDGKAKVDEHIQSIGLPASYFLAGGYMSNISGGMIFRRDQSTGCYTMHMPVPESAPMPLIDTRADTGKWIRGMVNKGVPGQRVLGATAYYKFSEMLDTFKKVFPKEGAKAKFVQVPHDQYQEFLKGAGFPPHVALEMLENMRLLEEFGYYGGESLDESIAVAGGVDKLTSLEQHLRNAPEFKDLE